jgi:hypothetical protein
MPSGVSSQSGRICSRWRSAQWSVLHHVHPRGVCEWRVVHVRTQPTSAFADAPGRDVRRGFPACSSRWPTSVATLRSNFKRHHLPPLGATSKYMPPPSNSLTGVSPSLPLREAVSVRGIWGQLLCLAGHLPPMLPPVAPGCQWNKSHIAGQEKGRKP